MKERIQTRITYVILFFWNKEVLEIPLRSQHVKKFTKWLMTFNKLIGRTRVPIWMEQLLFSLYSPLGRTSNYSILIFSFPWELEV